MEKLRMYVEDCMNRGFSPAVIRNNLKNKVNIPHEDIDLLVGYAEEKKIKKMIRSHHKMDFSDKEIKEHLLGLGYTSSKVESILQKVTLEKKLKGHVDKRLNQGFSKEEISTEVNEYAEKNSTLPDYFIHSTYKNLDKDFLFKLALFLVASLLVLIFGAFFDIPEGVFYVPPLFLVPLILFTRYAKQICIFTVIAFFVSEVMLINLSTKTGLVFYSLFLGCLMLILTIRDFKKEVKELLLAMMIIPLIRIIGSLMPLEELAFLSRLTIVYIIMIAASFVIYRNLSIRNINSSRYIKWLPLVLVFGALLGLIEFLILKPEIVFAVLSLKNVVIGLSAMLLTGFAEEFIFRGMLQNLFLRLFELKRTLLFSNILFSVLHLIWASSFEIIFVFSVGVIHGLIYHKTRNLVLVSLLHGFLNFTLFIIWPVLLS